LTIFCQRMCCFRIQLSKSELHLEPPHR
jgi:hypothetical protein